MIRKNLNPKMHRETNQKGMASIIVVGFLIILLTLISIGFTRIMNRSLQNSTADQQAAGANYAAQSGINSVATYLSKNGVSNYTKCYGVGDPQALIPTKVDPNFSSDTKLTCALVDSSSSAATQAWNLDTDAYQSKVVKLQSGSSTDKMTSINFSWQSQDTTKARNFANDILLRLFDEKVWQTTTTNDIAHPGLAPVLKVTLYKLPSSGNLNSAVSHTFFFYPQQSGATSVVLTTDKASPFQSIFGAKCDKSSGKDCDIDITVPLPVAGDYYYAQVTPIYSPASVKITAQTLDSGGVTGPTHFKDGQTIIDVTAKSGFAVKRLRAHVNLNSGDIILPDFALRSANTICKRYVNNAGVITVDGPVAQCWRPPEVTVTLTANPTIVPPGGTTTLTWTVTNATSCTASGDPSGQWSGSRTPTDGTHSQSGIVINNNTTFVIDCTNGFSSDSDSDDATVTVEPDIGLGNLKGYGFAPTHLELFATINPKGTTINRCWWNFDIMTRGSTTPPTTLRYRIDIGPAGGPPSDYTFDGVHWYSTCAGLNDNNLHRVYQAAFGWSGSSCTTGYGGSTVGNDDCYYINSSGARDHNFTDQNGDIIYFAFCATYNSTNTKCTSDPNNSRNACGVMDNHYGGSGVGDENEYTLYPHVSSPCHTSTFRWFCDAAYHNKNGYSDAGWTYVIGTRPAWCNTLY